MTIGTCEELDDAVEEYLEYRRFPNTLECFRSEIRHRKLMRYRSSHTANLTPSQTFIPKPLLRREASSPLAHEVRVAEFLSCVHCAVFPFRPAALAEAAGPREASVACAKSMSSFRRYLDRATLPQAQDREVVQFYALPHVPDPPAHPAFKDLFEDSWSATLRARIENIIDAVMQWRRRLAQEVSGGGRHNDRGGDRTSPPSEAVASAAIEAALLLQTIRWRFARAPPGKTRRGVLYHLIRNDIFDLRSVEVGKEGGAGHAVDTTLLELLLRLGAPLPSSPLSSPSPPLLPPSSEAEKDERTELSDDSQPQPYGVEQAPEAIQQQHQKHQPGGWGDDVCVKKEGGGGEHRGGWEEFGGDPGRLVAAYAARLLGVLVSMSKARSYVLGERCTETIALLAETLRGYGFRERSLTNRLLGVLARLSTRRHVAQEAIAASCFVDWAAKMLRSHSQGTGSRDPCPLFLGRTAEVLGNALCTSTGRAAAVAATPDLLTSLGNLLEHEDGQVRSHAIRALRLLLEAREARERALAAGMDAVLQDLRSRMAGSDNSTFARDTESLLDLLGGKLVPDADPGKTDYAGQEETDVDVEDFDCLSDDDPETEAEASVVSHFVRATKAPCGEELLRERYRLSTAETKEEGIVGFADGRPPWGGEEEELVCGGYKTRKAADGGNNHHHGTGESKEAENNNKTPRAPTPEAGTATLIRGEEKVYDSRRPGLPDEMQSRPRIPRTPAASAAFAPFGGSGRRQSNGAIADAKNGY
eukprot:g7678.t1